MGHETNEPVKSLTDRTSTRQATSADERVDVALVSMPFGMLQEPAVALGLLKASLDGPTCKVLYYTLPFAERIDPALYNWIASGSRPLSQFLGEYLFRPAAFPDGGWDDEDFWDGWIHGKESVWFPRPENLLARLEEVRRQVDPFVEECAAEILALRPGVVGFTSVFQQQLASLALARRLKEADPEIFVVFGGANCEGPMGREMVRQFDFLDAVVSGEGEIVFPQLVERALRGESVDDLRGVSSALDRETPGRPLADAQRVADMDSLPVPDYSDYFDAWEESGLHERLEPWLPYETSRGCWWGEKEHCTFCGLNGASMAFRSKSGERALSELDSLLARYPASRVQVVDNILDMRYFRTFLPALAEKRLDARLFYEVKANLGKKHLRQLKAAGVDQIQPGIESLSTHVLDAMGKGVTLLQNVRLLKWCQELEIQPFWNILWGFPEERPSDYEEMARLIPWLSHLTPPGFAGRLRLDRFSPNFERSEELGFADVRPDPAYRQLYPVDEEALSNMAYYFHYGYDEERDVAGYTATTHEAITEWQRTHAPGSLFYVDRGEGLLVWDRRPVATASLTFLHGVDRLLYLECDEIRGLRRLVRLLDGEMSAARVQEKLEELVDRGLMIREGEKFLSLAVRRELGQATQEVSVDRGVEAPIPRAQKIIA